MKTIKHTVTTPLGLHIRPAVILVKQAEAFPGCNIRVCKSSGETVDARRLFSILGLSISSNEQFEITIEGEREEEAFKAFQSFCECHLV